MDEVEGPGEAGYEKGLGCLDPFLGRLGGGRGLGWPIRVVFVTTGSDRVELLGNIGVRDL
jgi:hypothetical protein